MKNIFSTTLVLFSFTLLISCAQGGGSYSTGGTSQNNSPSEVGCGSMQDQACEMFVAINQYRSLHGLSAYNSLGKCIDMAEAHTIDMVVNKYFGHDSRSQSLNSRLIQYGLGTASATESIAQGSSDANVILGLLEKSAIDNDALLETEFHSIGVGFDSGDWTICYTALR